MSSDLRENVINAVKRLPEERLLIANRLLELLATSDDEGVDNLARLPDLADDDEADWEEAVLTERLGDALLPDRSIDYRKLDLMDVSLAELEAQIEDDEPESAS